MKIIDNDVSCLLIAYKRHEGVLRLLDQCNNSRVKKIYIAIDGPTDFETFISQEKLLNDANEFATKNEIELLVKRSYKNSGAAVSVISALDWFFACEEEGIIFEDDIDPHVDFFRFCKNNLQIYKNDFDVWMISGTQLFPLENDNLSMSWVNYPMIWGWATWAAKWKEMKFQILEQNIEFRGIREVSVRNFWQIGKRRALRGQIDAWDIPLAGSMRNLNKYALMPKKNLISNLGFDQHATHTKISEWPLGLQTCPLDENQNLSEDSRETSSNINNLLFERRLYKTSMKHVVSNHILRYFDGCRFRKSKRLGKLIERIR